MALRVVSAACLLACMALCKIPTETEALSPVGPDVDGPHILDGFKLERDQIREPITLSPIELKPLPCPYRTCNNGLCFNGQCACLKGWGGRYCQIKIRRCSYSNCRNGRCVGSRCVCNSGYTGPTCAGKSCSYSNCRNGQCVGDHCICHSGYSGPTCEVRSCSYSNCQNGRCVGSRCVCNSGYTGPTCAVRSCSYSNCRNGQCVGDRCICHSGYSGPTCEVRSCSYSNCRNGRCVGDHCICHSGYSGPTCEVRVCSYSNCRNGRCVNDKCVCNSGWTGSSCNVKAGICLPVPVAANVDKALRIRPRRCYRPACKEDNDCPGRKKCCPGGAAGSCHQCMCPPVLCRLFCKHGFKVDEHGCQGCMCNPGPQCVPPCKNGGTCAEGNKCQCPAGYTGRQCQTKILQEPECTTEGAVGFNECRQRCICRNRRYVECCRVRKEIHSMSQAERQLYIDTFKAAYARTDFRNLIISHELNFRRGIHTRDQFLPWHRYYLLAIENILQKIDCRVTLPYWAWCLKAANPWQPPLWGSANHWFGGNGGGQSNCVNTGPFRQGPWTTVSGQCLARDFTGTLPNCLDVNDVLSSSVAEFDDFEFRLRTELHDFVHCQIGGTMCSGKAAEAPEFLLHHGNVDKLWNDWQSKSTAHKQAHFSGLNNPMTAANGYSPRQLIDLANQPGDVCVVYGTSPPQRQLKNLFRKANAGQVARNLPCSARPPVSEKAISLFGLSSDDVTRLRSFRSKNICRATDNPGMFGPLGFSPADLERGIKTAEASLRLGIQH